MENTSMENPAQLTEPVTRQQTVVEKPLPELLGRRYRERQGAS